MARRWFGRVSCTIDSEQVFVTTNTNSNFTLNGSRVLTSQDVVTSPVQRLEAQNASDFALSTTETAMTIEGPLVPASVHGVSLLNSTTVQVTQKGYYQFQVQLAINASGVVNFVMKMDGNPVDAQGMNAYKVGAELYASPTVTFTFEQTTNTTHTFQFFVNGDTLPTTGNPIRGLLDLVITHWSFP